MTPGTNACSIRKFMFPLIISITTTLGCWQDSCASDVYKWLDEHQQVQYSQTPPPQGVRYSRINVAQPASPPHRDADGSGTDSTDSPQERARAMDEQNAASQKAASQAKEEAEVAKLRQQNCVTAKNNLMLLNQGGHLSYKDKDGNLVRLTEEDKTKRAEEAKKHIAEFCKK
jgi:hypothetical protein